MSRGFAACRNIFMVRYDLKYHSKKQATASRTRIRTASGSQPYSYTDSKQYSTATCCAASSIE